MEALAPARFHSLIDLEMEREPSLEKLEEERFSRALIEMCEARVRVLVSELP